MKFEEAKMVILEMADSVNSGTFTQTDLMSFILAFRFDLFQSPTFQTGVANGTYAISCSCASTIASCNECGPGYTTGFSEHNGQIVSFKTKKEI